ncbi:MAG: FHA domain-containing protein [Butyrivibrio sp.]|nr:FHA domain-containing protein [Acetatifactor muris]MCM1558523.1 FHA domain-containing protein [Butyrivibrio sp.]
MKNNNQPVWRRRVADTVCLLVFFLCFSGTGAYAAENKTDMSQAAVVSSRTAEDGIYIYIKGVDSITSGTTVQIGSTLCGDIQTAGVTSMGMPVKTTILFDNSQSLFKRWGSRAKELAKELIGSHGADEEFRIATFADGLNVVADFTAEYEALEAAVEEIEFLDQESYLTDILYDLLKQSRDEGGANYTRLIIITDGADDKDIKYTQTELSDLMKSSGVVIHTIGVKTSKNSTLLENLFSYARLTGGVYETVDADTDVTGIRDMINEDYSLLCLKLVPEADSMDGSRKEAKLKLATPDGEVVLTTSLQMPFADLSNLPVESAEPDVPLSSEPAEEKEELPSIAVEPRNEKEVHETEKSGIITVVAVIGAVAAVLVTGILLTVLLVLKSKRKKPVNVVIANNGQHQANAQSSTVQASAMQQGKPAPRDGNTVRLGGQISEAAGGKTVCLQGGVNAPRQTFIMLTDINNPQRSFRAPIDTRIVIGREAGDIVLGHDAAVSHTHCEILKKGNLFYVNDLKSSNGTFYGNMRVYHETPIMNGGILEVGTCKYKITIEG